MMRRILMILILFFVIPFAHAVESYQFVSPEQQVIYERLTHNLRCLVCQNQSLADSNAELARDFRQQIAAQLKSGKSQEEILSFFTQRYGEFILYEPRLSAKTSLLWLGPCLLVLIALMALVIILKRQPKTAVVLSVQEKARLAEALAGSGKS